MDRHKKNRITEYIVILLAIIVLALYGKYTGHAAWNDGDEWATTSTALDTAGKTYTCQDCISNAGAAGTCASTGSTWYMCEFKVTCTT